MSPRKPPGVSVADWRDRQVTEALARGDFDGLPGAGRPIPDLDRPLSALGWAISWARREGGDLTAALPLALAMRREREQLVDAVPSLASEAAVRALVADFNVRLDQGYRRPQGVPPLATPFVDVERQVGRWQAARPAPAARVPEPSPEPVGSSRHRRSWRRAPRTP